MRPPTFATTAPPWSSTHSAVGALAASAGALSAAIIGMAIGIPGGPPISATACSQVVRSALSTSAS